MDCFCRIKDMKTLLVDDDSLIRSSLSLIFMSKDCFLLAKETAEQGLEAAKKTVLILLSAILSFREWTGWSFSQKWRKFSRIP